MADQALNGGEERHPEPGKAATDSAVPVPAEGALEDGAVLPPGMRRPAPMLPLPLTLIVLGLTYWCVDIVSPALPVIQADLQLSGAGAGLLMSTFFFGRLVTNFPAAFVIERVGPRGCAQGGALVLALGSAGAALAPGEPVLLAMRGLQGAGVALLATAGLLSVLRAWPGGGAAMTAFNVAAGVGGGLGLYSGGLISAQLSWRGVFWLSFSLAGLMLAGSLIAHAVQGRRPLPASVVESGPRPQPLVVTRGLAAGIAANLLVYINYSIWVVALALFATQRFQAGPSELGTLLLVVNIVHLVAAVPAGHVIRRTSAVWAMSAGFGVAAVGMVMVAVAPSFGWLVPAMTLIAVGQVASNSAAGDLVLRLGGGGGRAVGLLRLTSDIGLVAGPIAIGAIADLAGARAPFLMLAAMTIAGSALAWWAAHRTPRPALSSVA